MVNKPSIDELFDRSLTYPDVKIQDRYKRLIGLDSHKTRLLKLLSVLINPAGLKSWTKQFHPGADALLDIVFRRPPLVVLAGDVGSGKTELAETVGDAVARQESIDVTLFPLSLSTRGQGRVGEMTKLLTVAFDYTYEEAIKLRNVSGVSRGAVIFLVDEADALAQSREAAQMHHEDRAGVNAFIRGIDRIANEQLPAAIIMCTNRLSALDPAITRRAADILTFMRPNEMQRLTLLEPPLQKLGFSVSKIQDIVDATGKQNGKDYGYTYSDLTQRLLPSIVLDAYPNASVDPDRALKLAQETAPTAPFRESVQ